MRYGRRKPSIVAICGFVDGEEYGKRGAAMRLMLWGSGACYGEAEPPI